MNTQVPEKVLSPSEAEFQGCCGKRVVLTTVSELSFCGEAKTVLTVEGTVGGLVETDPATGFAFWCPLDAIKQITVIPLDRRPPQETGIGAATARAE